CLWTGRKAPDGAAFAAHPELYDPSTGTFSLAGPYAAGSPISIWCSCALGLTYTTATVLADGKVLILSEPAAQLYDPITNTFSVTGSMVVVDEGNVWGKPSDILEVVVPTTSREHVPEAHGTNSV